MGYDPTEYLWHDRHVYSEKCCIGEVIFGPGGICGPRVQRDYELVLLHSGELNVRVNGQERSLPVGQVGLFLPGQREYYQFSRTHNSHHSWCTVHPSLMPPEMRSALAGAPRQLVRSDVMDRLLATGLAIGSVGTKNARRLVDYVALSLFAEYLEAAEDYWAQQSRDVIVAKAARFLAEHLAEANCLQLVDKAIGVSRKTLIQRFQRDFKTTPARYLWRVRTERGIEMLTETGLTVAEIAYKCGFQNPFHFSRRVKEYQGISPKEVRRKAWRFNRQLRISRASP
jgi:AraC family transcriptional regulator of arabinose operon